MSVLSPYRMKSKSPSREEDFENYLEFDQIRLRNNVTMYASKFAIIIS